MFLAGVFRLLLSICFLSTVSAGKVLAWPADASHFLNLKIILEELAHKGHDVTVLVHSAMMVTLTDNTSSLKYENFPVPFTKEKNEKFLEDFFALWIYGLPKMSYWEFYEEIKKVNEEYLRIQEHVCNGVVKNELLLKKLKEKKFDVVISDPLAPCGELAAELLGVPFVYSFRYSMGNSMERLCGQLPAPFSYVPGSMAELTDKMSFVDRLKNMNFYIFQDIVFHLLLAGKWDGYFSEALGRPTTLCEIMGKAEIWLIRTYWDFEYPRPLLPNFEFVGGLHCKPPKPLPEDMEKIAQSSGEHGMIVFSLGSMVKNLTDERSNVIAAALSQLPQKVALSKSLKDTTSRLAELGWLHNKVRKYTDQRSLDRAFGLVGQSFCAALHQELKEYYRLLSVLHSQLQVEDDQGVNLGLETSLTLRRLLVWTYDPKIRLKTLAALVDHCQGRKGGELASAVHAYTKTGDPYMRSLVQHILGLASHPILNFLYRWIYDGELEDTYHEFFVASDPTVKTDRLWHDKYTLRKSMIPSFITMDQSRKVLLIGKSINFLHQVCHDQTPTAKMMAVTTTAESPKDAADLFTDLENAFQSKIDAAYFETSKYLLDVLNKDYNLLGHLQAMRRYLLLGQGDFIRHLMDLLKPELVRPATTLYQHNLTGILETAVRATNAQFDNPEILKRLDVRLLEVSPGDTGWDVFSLDYHVDGPIATVFTRECMSHYLRVFNFLWRAKRMEYILTDIWKGHMCNAKLLKSMPEFSGVLHQCHVLASEMVHFIHQMQYYITFEVLECSWDELWNKVQQAQDLDHIIAAHEVFLDTIISRCLLDSESRALLNQLRAVFDQIIEFQNAQEVMYRSALEELQRRLQFEERKKQRESEGEWGVTAVEEDEENKRVLEFQESIPKMRSQLRILTHFYQGIVQQFLVLLTTSTDESLRFLSFRLDFNEHYKAREPRLRMSLGTRGRRSLQV